MPHNAQVPASSSEHPDLLRLLTALALMVVAALATAWVGTGVILTSDRLQDWDVAVTERTSAWTVRHGVDGPLLLWQAVTRPWVLYSVLGVLAVSLIGARRSWRAWWVLPVGALGWALPAGVKGLVGRPRPTPSEVVTQGVGFSYPSGHVAGATVSMILLLWLLWPLARRAWRRFALVLLALALVASTCLDRLFLGVHYPSDVAMGLVIGVTMTAPALILARPAS